MDRSLDVWQVVARVRSLRVASCIVLWVASLAALFWSSLALPRDAGVAGSIAAALRTLVLVRQGAPAPQAEVLLGLSLVSDTVLLAWLLDLTGGPYNPFIVVFPVYVWLAGVTTSRRWALLVATISAASLAWLVFDHLRAGQVAHHALTDLPTHLVTMWFSLTAVAELVAHYVARATAVFRAQQREADQARARAERSERHASLMTLAAGAAHELSTPLATIAVAARELEHTAAHLAGTSADVEGLRDDARLIRAEVDRCQQVLDAMTGRATSGVPLDAALPVQAIVDAARMRLIDGERDRVRVDMRVASDLTVACGAEAVQAIGVLLKNAVDASAGTTTVSLRVSERDGHLRIEVHDDGGGMSTDSLRRAGEPFFTTKEPGRGTGLGLFLAGAFLERVRGTLDFDVTQGTTAIMEIPVGAAEGQGS